MTRRVEALLRASGYSVYAPETETQPDLVGVRTDNGILAIDVVDDEPNARVHLNRKVAALRDAVPEIARSNISRRVADLSTTVSTPSVLTCADMLRGDWLAELPEYPVDQAVADALAAAFAPRVTIDVPLRHPLTDHGAGGRAAHRIVLDRQQAAVAQRNIADVLVITGPPGSGKTLVLAARATWLAREHPDWRIQLLCFNRVLVPYLEALVGGHANISVHTFGKFSHALGYRVSLSDEERAERDVARQLPTAASNPALDALLIDEWQDFIPAWVELAIATVRPGRGGIAVAGDQRQALYRDTGMSFDLPGRSVEYLELDRPYRSTRQILEVTSKLDDTFAVANEMKTLDGEPVDLVWAESADQQAAAVTRDTLLLLQTGKRTPEDVAILVTRRFQMGKLATHLGNEEIPHRIIYSNKADELDLAEPTVKIMTVHSAKGLEFDVVFLVGLEHLPNPDGALDTVRQGRAGYVGATRARDQLILTYTKDNAYLERVRTIPDRTLRRWVWPDDYPEA